VRILLTGTGAADGIPAFAAESRVSNFAREHGGKDIRTRAAAVIDDQLRLDFGPDTFAQVQKLNLHVRDWKAILFTHSHDDHYAPKELQYLFPPFVNGEFKPPTVYGNANILDGFEGSFGQASHLPRTLIKSFESSKILGYTVTPILAYHKLDEDSMNFIIQSDKTFLYATDTGVYQDATWEFLQGWKFDAAVIECTDGVRPTEYWGHLSCDELIGMVGRLRTMGCLSERSRVVTTHHSAAGMATHAELEACLNPHGIEVGFDGMLMEI